MAFFKTFEEIRSSFVGYMAGTQTRVKDTREIAILGTIASAFSSITASAWKGLADLRQAWYVEDATGLDLLRKVALVGMTTGQGSLSAGDLVAILATGTLQVPSGTLLKTGDNIVVQTTSTITVTAPYSVIPATAVEVGVKGNLPVGTALTSLDGAYGSITFRVGDTVTSGVITGDAFEGGTDKESDASIKARYPAYLKSIKNTTYEAVRQALLGTTGVVNLVLENAKPAGGYMTITVQADSGSNISNTLRNAIAATMLASGPAGMAYVLKAQVIDTVDVTVTAYTTNASLSPTSIKTAVAAAITDMTSELLPGRSIYRADIQDAGYLKSMLTNFEVNLPVADKLAAANQVYQIGTVTVNVVYT